MTTTELKQYIEKVLGNNIRCLLPSYWWKRLFNQVADRIDTAEQYAEELVDASKMPIVESEEELNKLDLEDGNLAAVLWQETKERSFRELYQTSIYEALGGNFSRCTVVEDIITRAPNLDRKVSLVFGTADGSRSFSLVVEGTYMTVITHENKQLYLYKNGEYVQEGHDYLREELSSFQYIFAIAMDLTLGGLDNLKDLKVDYDLIDPFLTCVAILPAADVYVKGNTWERLAKKDEVGENTGSSGLPIYIALGNASLTTEQIAANKNTLANIYKEIPYAVFEFDLAGEKVSFRYPIALYFASTTNTLFYITDWDNGTSDLLGFSLNSDGTVTRVSDKKAGGLETRSFKSTNSTTDKEWNRNTVNLFLEGKANIVYSFNNAGLPEGTGGELMLNAHIYQDGNHRFCFFEQHPSGGYTDHGIIIQSDGTYDDDVEVFKPDTEMYDTSTNLVQNKVIKKYVDTEVAKKVDKVSGKGLSTEDFTTLLKTKLEGLENYDDTTLSNAISSLETRLNTLVSGDTSTAIESFNEVVAFLENLTDTQDLSSIIASIEQQINAKQDKINDLDDIRSGASLGKTSLQEHQDISHLATKEELQNVVDEVLETEEVYAAAVNDLNNRVTTTDTLLATETTNREALQTEVQTINTNILDNEEVIAATLVDINTKIDSNYQYGETTYSTKDSLSTEIQTVNTSILDNEEIIAATLTNLNSQIASLNGLIAELTTRIETLENA